MAEQIKFVDTGNNTLLDLNAVSGLTILYGTGVPERAPDSEVPVIETYQCKLTGTSDDDLASQLNTLNRILERAARYGNDSTEENEIWLIDQLANESNARRTLMLGGSWKYDSNPHSVPTRNEHTAFITLAIKRMPGYEAIAAASPIQATVSVFGGNFDLSTQATGDMPSRPEFYVVGNTGAIETLWMGMRSYLKHPDGSNDVTNFVPIWEAELGTMGTNTATSAAYDATSTGSTPKAILVSFANANWDERVRIIVPNISGGNNKSQMGRFLVLGRMRLDTGTDTVQARLRSGWYNSAVTPQYKTLDPVTVSGTSFQYYELGTIKLPPIFGSSHGDPITYGDYGMINAAISLLAARTSGTTSKLVVDHFAMVPIDEGFVKIGGLALSATSHAIIYSTPKNTPLTAAYSGTGFTGSPAISQNMFYIPVGTSRVYIFGQRSGVSVVGDDVVFATRSWTRYFSLRGTA